MKFLHLDDQLEVFIFCRFKLLLERALFNFSIQKSLSQHVGVVPESLIFLVHLSDVALLLFVKLAVVESLLLEVVDFHLEVLNLLVLFHFELLAVDLFLEAAQLAHHKVHVAAVSIQKVLLLIRKHPLHDAVDRTDLLVYHVQGQHHFFCRV